MHNTGAQKAEQYAKNHHRRSLWQRIVGGLACVVVFVTTYVLILPAITLGKTAYCGHDEHHHGECHHHHHHHHHHGEGEALEYGISTFVYFRRRAFDMNKFDYIVTKKWPKSVIRCKGICYFSDERDMCYVFEQAGKQVRMSQAGNWFAAMSPDELEELKITNPSAFREWDEQVGDRMQKLVFIGQDMDREAIVKDLDYCLEEE